MDGEVKNSEIIILGQKEIKWKGDNECTIAEACLVRCSHYSRLKFREEAE